MKNTFLLGFLLTVGTLFSQDLSISQIDASRLLTRQEITLYLNMGDAAANPEGLSSDQIQVKESSDRGQTFKPVPLLSFSGQAPADEGITFFLLVDNSGSMYLQDQERIRQVREALKTFLGSVESPKDSFGLSEFNTLFKIHTPPIKDRGALETALGQITQPERAEGYTELYEGILQGLKGVDAYSGRKVMILLSDGEYFPYARGEKLPHPLFGDRVSGVAEVEAALNKTGITLYAIRFGDEKEKILEDLTKAGGGQVYDAMNQEELEGVYQDIRARVLQEYRITYRATMDPAEKRLVQVTYQSPQGTQIAQREYFAGTLFGLPSSPALWLLPLMFFLGLALWFLLTQWKFINKSKEATLEVLSGGYGKTIAITDNRTVIGAGAGDNMTIVGAPGLKESQATIIYDKTKAAYTLVSEIPLKVNNKIAEKGRRLESGDVIQVGGVTIVFDESREKD